MTIHIVKSGDTVYNIANRYGVSPERVMVDNGISNQRNLVIGQALLILVPREVYTVKAGDTLESIARQYGTTVMVLKQNNPNLITNPTVYVGQQITISFWDQKVREIEVNGYAYPYIERPVLQRTLPYLSTLTIFGYGFTMAGELIPINDQPLINMAWENQTAPIMLISSITEDGNFSGERASYLFNNLRFQNALIEKIIATMKEKGYVGIDIDFEYIEAKDSQAYVNFLRNITPKMHAEGYTVNVDLAPKTSDEQPGLLYQGHDYAAIGAIVDSVLIMTYEWGYTYGPPMAVAPVDKVRQVVRYAVSKINPNKIMMGIPNYGYDWTLPFVKGESRARGIGNQQAIQIAAQYGAEIQFDQTAQSPFFEYYDWNGAKHIVWFEDVRSIKAKLNTIVDFGLRGAGYWQIMRPFNQNWALLSAMFYIQKEEDLR